MKILRWHTSRGTDQKAEVKAYILPSNWREKVFLFLRGYRPAHLTYVPIPWWTRQRKNYGTEDALRVNPHGWPAGFSIDLLNPSD